MPSRLPEPASEVLMDLTGHYWRRNSDGMLSIPPTTASNDPVIGPYAVYRLAGREDHDGKLHPIVVAASDGNPTTIVLPEPDAMTLEDAALALLEACQPYIDEAAPGEQMNGVWNQRFDALCECTAAVRRALTAQHGPEVQS